MIWLRPELTTYANNMDKILSKVTFFCILYWSSLLIIEEN